MCHEDKRRPFSQEEQRRLEVARSVIEELKNASSKFITAIARTTDSNQGDFVGSGSFMVFGGRVFLVTAMHVAMDALHRAKWGAAFASGSNDPYQLITAPFCLDNDLDIAIAPVTLDHSASLPRQACSTSSIAEEAGQLSDCLFVHGYPGKRSKFLMLGPGIHSESLPWATVTVESSWQDFDPNLHFAIGFDPTHARYVNGDKAHLPDPDGMSGSAVWNTRRCEIGTRWQASDARIVGVIHRWDQEARCLIGTKIEHIHRIVDSSL
ncbi:hypothetical protein [Actomonas aquatica]|uniref:Serine protease n=1 Tax=Actomonas aquatica TaxID=2866162 RepID=A0ABZ1C2U1_9BACT|nr:hypothetical protein [Opitutus sp. WL0086]WRQ85563.1 hypothetical protein K1X11_012190 [Opitutus sp. WL0086]